MAIRLVGPKQRKWGFPITNPTTEIEDLLWKVYESFESEMKFNEPFDPLKLVLNSEVAANLLTPTQQVQIPSNLPAAVLQQVYQQVLAQVQVVQIPPIDYELFQASVETSNSRSDFRTAGKIFSNKLADNNIAINIIPTFSGWKFIPEELPLQPTNN